MNTLPTNNITKDDMQGYEQYLGVLFDLQEQAYTNLKARAQKNELEDLRKKLEKI